MSNFHQILIHIFKDNFLLFSQYNHIEQSVAGIIKMGNSTTQNESNETTAKFDNKSCMNTEADLQQKNMSPEFEQHQNPLTRAFQKGILKKSIVASNNKLIDSRHFISSAPSPKIENIYQKPRVSLDEMLLSRQNLEKLKKISNKIIEEASIISDLSSQSQKENINQSSLKQSRKYRPILLNQENLIKIQETNIHKKYKLLQKIGQGGFGVVYRSLCLSTQQQRAVKVITLKNYSSFHKKLILNQISMLLKIDHPNIIKIYEIIHSQSTYYIVTEYCEGGTLCDYLNKHKRQFGETFARNIMKKLLSAIKYLHSKNIIHRDIKLDNIVLKNGKNEGKDELIIKIIDFGLAIQTRSSVFKSDKVIGTPQYIAPESIIGMHSLKSDIWSCGIIFYMLLVGQSPFRAPTKSKIFTKIKREEIQLHNYAWKNISLQAKDLLYRMLSKCTINRPTAHEALNHSWFQLEFDNESPKVLQNNAEIAKGLAAYQKKNNLVSFVETYTCLTKLSQEQREKLIKYFNHIDSNQNGVIQITELKTYLSKNQIKMNDQQITSLLKKLDLNQNDKLDLNQFICALSNLERYYEKEYIAQIFNLFDQNNDGYIDRKQLKNRLSQCKNQQINHLFKMIDINNDKNISEEEFRRYLLNKRTGRRSVLA